MGFVPPIPNELTPALRRVGPLGQGRTSVLTKKGLLGRSIAGCGASKCRLGTSVWCLSMRHVLISPAIPEAASRWPMLVFTEPSAQCARLSLRENASVNAAISTGSPRGVPVPCASTYEMVLGSPPRESLSLRDDGRLALNARSGISRLGVSIVIRRGTSDHGVNGITIRERILDALQDHDARAIAHDRALRPSVESTAPAIWRKDHALLKQVAGVLRHMNMHGARQSDIAVAAQQAKRRHVNGHEGRRASVFTPMLGPRKPSLYDSELQGNPCRCPA